MSGAIPEPFLMQFSWTGNIVIVLHKQSHRDPICKQPPTSVAWHKGTAYTVYAEVARAAIWMIVHRGVLNGSSDPRLSTTHIVQSLFSFMLADKPIFAHVSRGTKYYRLHRIIAVGHQDDRENNFTPTSDVEGQICMMCLHQDISDDESPCRTCIWSSGVTPSSIEDEP